MPHHACCARCTCRVVLAACLHALKNPGEPFYAVARHFLQHRLLAATDPPAGGAAAAAAQAAALAAEGVPACSDGSPMAIDSDDSGPGNAKAVATGAAQQRQRRQEPGHVGGAAACLAGRVFAQLPPREQAWVWGHVEKWSGGGWGKGCSCFVFEVHFSQVVGPKGPLPCTKPMPAPGRFPLRGSYAVLERSL